METPTARRAPDGGSGRGVDRPALDLFTLDLTTLAGIVGESARGRVRQALADAGHPALRDAHGYVVQRLLDGEPTIGELAQALDMTQQGASKHIVELERLGYVERVADTSDSRIRRVRLTAGGRDAVEVARAARSAIDARLRDGVGEADLEAARRVLVRMLSELGVEERVRTRTVPEPPTTG